MSGVISDKGSEKFAHLPILQFNTMRHLEKTHIDIMLVYTSFTLTIGKFTHGLKAHAI